jgi:glucosamine--fructose-6-phosphate aminotransferase (isomerizing)
MCGIVGYIGKREVTPVLIEGLKKLEYRGYDSAGVAILNDHKINLIKSKGRLSILEEKVNAIKLEGS